MSLASLPNELLFEIFYDAAYTSCPIPSTHFDAIGIQPSIACICHRLRDVVGRVLYTHPRIRGYSTMRRFVLYLHRHPELAVFIKTFAFTLKGDGSHYIIWSSLHIPFLPNCLEMHISPEDEDPNSVGALPFIEILTWATNCPKLGVIALCGAVDGALDSGQTDYEEYALALPVAKLDLDLPRSLHTLRLEKLTSIEEGEQFWALCPSWMTHLSITGDGRGILEEFSMSNLDDLESAARHVTCLQMRNIPDDVVLAVPTIFHSLETLDLEFPFSVGKDVWPCLSLFRIYILWQGLIVDALHWPLELIGEWLTSGAAPALERLLICPILGASSKESDWEGALTSADQEALQLRDACCSRGIELALQITG